MSEYANSMHFFITSDGQYLFVDCPNTEDSKKDFFQSVINFLHLVVV